MANEIPDELFKRMVLGNQYEILSIIDADNRLQHEQAARMVREGYPIDEVPSAEWTLSYLRDPFTPAQRELLYDAMSLFARLQLIEDAGYKPPEPWSDADFPGFDGNNEGRYMAYARYAVDYLEKYTYLRFGAKDLNSHCPMVDSYERMVEAWKGLGKPHDLTTAQADAIWAARTHPSYRQ